MCLALERREIRTNFETESIEMKVKIPQFGVEIPDLQNNLSSLSLTRNIEAVSFSETLVRIYQYLCLTFQKTGILILTAGVNLSSYILKGRDKITWETCA